MPTNPEVTNHHAKGVEAKDNLTPLDKQRSRELGAKILTRVNFDTRQEDIINSSFNKARANGEKLPGKNNERRNYAYLSRLERMIGKYGSDLEKRLWRASMKDSLLVKFEDIPESYWKSIKQQRRDNGEGAIELTDELKREQFEKDRRLQKESLGAWANYLGSENCPFPLWFKIFAWDGMTKMGKYNADKEAYEVRNETTIAPYPDPNAETLGMVFEIINRYHGNNEKEFFTKDGERNINLEKLLQSCNFAKIYNAVERETMPIMRPPENPEDIHGVWVEHGIDEIDDVVKAAKGTEWCISSTPITRRYFRYGKYGADGGGNYYNDQDRQDEKDLKSRFFLFHLEDPLTKILSRNAVASVRLDPDGKVAEISGIEKNQALSDSLVSIVEEKVKSLPGGKEYLLKFHDKHELIRLDHKMENNEDLTKEELEFIYEINRPIATLDTYNSIDPRVPELRKKYGIEYALGAGIDIDKLVSSLDHDYADMYLTTLLSYGANIDNLVSRLDSYSIIRNLDILVSHDANMDNLVSHLDSYRIESNLGFLISHNANIDTLVSHMDSYSIDNVLDDLFSYNVDIKTLVSRMEPYYIAKNIDTLISHGANIDVNGLVSRLEPYHIAKCLDDLIAHGANIDINGLVSSLDPKVVAENLDSLVSHGAIINIDELVSRMGSYYVPAHLATLLSHGASVEALTPHLAPYEIAKNLDILLSHGANVDTLISLMSPYYIATSLDTLISHGASIDVNQLALSVEPRHMSHLQDILRRHGANV